MDISKRPWPISTLYGIRDRIDTNPDYQRPTVWSFAQKQLLIDTILRGYDVPKLYWRKTGSKPDSYEVVDGQQRIRAICEFINEDYNMPKKADDVEEYAIASLKYSDLPDELRIRFDTYPLDVIIVSDTDEDEVREMFLRLQNGTTLKAQEKRNAMTGEMRGFVKDLAQHNFFAVSVPFKNSRYTYDHLAAQITLIEQNGGPCNVKNANLNALYIDNSDFDVRGIKAKKIVKVLDFLYKAFPEKVPEISRYDVISLYTMVSQLLEKFAISEMEEKLFVWYLEFESYRRSQKELSEDESDRDIVIYHDKISHSTDAEDSILWRHEFLTRKFFSKYSDIEMLDDLRMFTHEQRLTIFRRDKGFCQLKIKCDGKKCDWDNWEADHKVPWSKSGKTTVLNGQVACPECNSSKQANLL